MAHYSPLDQRGKYDYLIFNYVNAIKERILTTAIFPEGGNGGAENGYGKEDLTGKDLNK